MNFRVTIRQVMGCCLALALLLVPLFGLMHGIVHDFSHGLPTTVVGAHVQPDAQTRADDVGLVTVAAIDAPQWSKKLFAGHKKAADCLVFDQLCHAVALPFLPLQVSPTPLPNILLVTLAGDFIARWAALYQARGPPSAR